ncbi:MAG: DNA polymerase IV [Mycoplasmatales bacterium]
MRKIIHVDMDAFFASVEQRDNPQYRNKPLVVAGNSKLYGVVSTCSYEARVYGIRSAMSVNEAYQRCPKAIFISGNYHKYQEASQIIFRIFREYTDKIEGFSLDEAYLDVTENKLNERSATKIGLLIKAQIFRETKLTCSVGVSYNKFLAKVAGEFKKPDGLFTITPEIAVDFIKDLPIKAFPGVGKKSVVTMHKFAIYTGADLAAIKLEKLINVCGEEKALHLKELVRGIDHSPVQRRERQKSIGREITFYKPLITEEDFDQHLENIVQQVFKRLNEKNYIAKTITVKVRYADFTTYTRSRTVEHYFNQDNYISKEISALINRLPHQKNQVRLLGVSFSNLEPNHTNQLLPIQLHLYE